MRDVSTSCLLCFHIGYNFRLMKSAIMLLLLLIPGNCFAQKIRGVVKDDKKEPLVNANVTMKRSDTVIAETITDFDGIYEFQPLEAGSYDITVNYIGHKTATTTKVIFSIDEKTAVNFTLLPGLPGDSIVKEYKKPLVDRYRHNDAYKLEEIKKMPRYPPLEFIMSPIIYSQAIEGVVTSVNKSPLKNATIELKKGGVSKNFYSTDSSGRYFIKPIDTGYYEIIVTYKNFKPAQGLARVTVGMKTYLNVELNKTFWGRLFIRK